MKPTENNPNHVPFKKETEAEEIIFIDVTTNSKCNNPNPEPFKKEQNVTVDENITNQNITTNNNISNRNSCCDHLERIEQLELELNKK